MKGSYNQERFDESELIDWMEEIIAHAIQELGYNMADFKNNQFRKEKQTFVFQKLKEKLVIDQSINKIWQAVEDRNLEKINSIKQEANYDEFLFKLGIIFSAFAVGVDSSSIEFLLHNTEISSSKFDDLKNMAVCTFTDEVFYDEQLAKQLLLNMDSSLALDTIASIQCEEYIADESLINLLSNIKGFNEAFVRKIRVDRGDLIQSETTLLSTIIWTTKPRLELIKWLINNGAQVNSKDIHQLIHKKEFSDDFFIDICTKNPDVAELYTENMLLDGANINYKFSLLISAIHSKRPELMKWLINNNKAADIEATQNLLDNADISDNLVITFLKNCKQRIDQKQLIVTEEQISSLNYLYSSASKRSMDVFEALVSYLKVDKDDGMDYTTISINDKLINLGNCWDIFHLKNSLSEKYIKFEAWISNPDIHSIASLFNAVRSSSKSVKKTFEDTNANELQDIHIDQVQHFHRLAIEETVREYFIANWHKSFLITKNITQFRTHLENQDNVNNVAEALFESYKHDDFKLSGEES